MSCTKNKKKFLFINYLGPHIPIDTYVRIWGSSSWNKYEVNRSCAICDCNLDSEIRSESSMLKKDYDIKKLHNMHRGIINLGESAEALKIDIEKVLLDD